MIRTLLQPCLAISILPVSLLSGCGSRAVVRRDIQRTIELDGVEVAKLQVESPNGSVRIVEDESTAELRVVGIASASGINEQEAIGRLEEFDLHITRVGPAAWRIEPSMPLLCRSHDDTSLSIVVPGLGDTRIDTGNGSIVIPSSHGSLDLRTGNGQVDVRSVRGATVARTGNGRIMCGLDGLRGGGMVELRIGNGDISLELPSARLGTLAATTGHGGIERRDGAGELVQRARCRSMSIVGEGETPIVLETGNGSIQVQETR